MMVEHDLAFFVLLARKGSFTAAALELGLSPPAISKRLAKLEDRLGVRLLNRTTRTVSLTSEGEAFLDGAAVILRGIEDLEHRMSTAREQPKGLIRINATFGFGREHISGVVSRFCHRFPDVEVQLILSDAPLNLVEEGFDLGIRFGNPPNSRLVARKLIRNRRFLCAAPAYLERRGTPKKLSDLMQHTCIVLRQDTDIYDVWRFQKGARSETVKVHGNLSSNDGEAALNWVLDGHGIMLRSEWDIARHVRAGRLSLVLPEYAHVDADIHVVYPERHNLSAKVRAFVEFLSRQIQETTAISLAE